MKKVGIIGFGSIGKKLYELIVSEGLIDVVFIYDDKANVPDNVALSRAPVGEDFARVDLVVEAAVSQVVKEYGGEVLKYTHFMPLSVTAFADQKLYESMVAVAAAFHHRLLIPHGAILGLEGVFDGRELFTEVQIVTTKNPKSLGRSDTEKCTVFEGSAREAALVMPRNVNVHAALALAGIGFDHTKSIIVSDPNINTNRHVITAKSDSTMVEVVVQSHPIGAVTGAFTPVSAYGSVKRALGVGGAVVLV